MSASFWNGSFKSSFSGGEVAYSVRRPDVDARGIVQICHGMNEYADRYDDFAGFLAARGFVVCGHDHAGHGVTAASDADLGFIPRRGGAEGLADDTHIMTNIIKQKFPGLPLILLGRMGSFISRIYITKYGDELAGVILSGTAGPGQPAAMGRLLSRVVGIGSHGRRRSTLIDKIAFGSYNKRFGDGAAKFAWLSRDEDIVEKYSHDKYCSSFIFTTDAFYVLFDMLSQVSSKKWASSVPAELPMLLASGSDDPVGNYGKGVREVYRRLLEAGVRDVTIKVYDGMRHEILNELGRRQVYTDMLGWIECHLPDEAGITDTKDGLI